ncbi:MAG: septation protein IspZ [Oligoflexales bacterium]|nr:septation protein IspZ [Oligoflexales bacterium]
MDKVSLIKSLETISLIGFGIAYWKYDLNTATLVLMVLMTLFVVLVKILGEKLSKLQIFSWLVIVILGGASLLSQDDSVIKWKTTIIHSGLSLVFFFSHLIGQKTILERALEGKIEVRVKKLRRLNAVCGGYFFFISALNLFVAFSFSTSVWVQFKLFGLLAINFVFVGFCLYYLREEIKAMMQVE